MAEDDNDDGFPAEWMQLLGGDAEEEEEAGAPEAGTAQPQEEPASASLSGVIDIADAGEEDEQEQSELPEHVDAATDEAPSLSYDRSLEFTSALEELPAAAPPKRIQKTAKSAPSKPPPSLTPPSSAASTAAAPSPFAARAVAKAAVGASAASTMAAKAAAGVGKTIVRPALQGPSASPFGAATGATGASPFGAPSGTAGASPFGAPVGVVGASPFGAASGTSLAKVAPWQAPTLATPATSSTSNAVSGASAAAGNGEPAPAKKISSFAASIAARTIERKKNQDRQTQSASSAVEGVDKTKSPQAIAERFKATMALKKRLAGAPSTSTSAGAPGALIAASNAALLPPWKKGGRELTTSGKVGKGKGDNKSNPCKGGVKSNAGKGKDMGKSKVGKGKGTQVEVGKGGGKLGKAPDLKRTASAAGLSEHSVAKKSDGGLGKVDSRGMTYDLSTVVVNFANVGSSYGKKCLNREPGGRAGLFDWDGVRRCCMFLKMEKKVNIVGVINENYTATDNDSWAKLTVPSDIAKMCVSIEETPRLPGAQHSSADDEMTIKCAYRRNCFFLDNDHYRDWKQQMRDEKIRSWLEKHADLLQMRYYFDKGLRTFDLLEGNYALYMLVPVQGEQPKKLTSRQDIEEKKKTLWHAPRS